MSTNNFKPYLTPCSEFLSMDLEGITCISNGDYSDGQLSSPVPDYLFEDPIIVEDLLQ